MLKRARRVLAIAGVGILGGAALAGDEIRVEIHTKTGGGCGRRQILGLESRNDQVR